MFVNNSVCMVYNILTSDVISVAGIELFDSSVSECQFPHPVHASPHSSSHTQSGSLWSLMKTVCVEIVRAANSKTDVTVTHQSF